MLAMGRKLTLGCAALMCAASLAACGGGGETADGSDSAGEKPASTPKPQPPKPHGPILRVENDAESYTAQIVSSSLSYESPDGTPVGTDSVYLAVVMVVKSGLNRPTRAPGWDQIDVKKPEWGDSTPTLKPVTNYFTTDQVDATGKGHGAGVRPVTGKLEANTPYYATFGVEIGTDTDVKGSQLCGYPDENPRCIPIGTVTPPKS